MSAVETNEAAVPQPVSNEKQITRLPPYFPLSCKQCSAQTEAFFQCFEKYAVMMNDHDTTTAHTSLQHCQPELRAYMTFMEKHRDKNDKKWWQLW